MRGKRRSQVETTAANLTERQEVRARIMADLAQTEQGLEAVEQNRREREELALEAELDGVVESGGFGSARRAGLSQRLALEEERERLSRLLLAAEARVATAEREHAEALADEHDEKLRVALRCRDAAVRDVAADLLAITEAFASLRDARTEMAEVAVDCDRARAAAGLAPIEIPDEPLWEIHPDVLAGLSAGPQRPLEVAAEESRRSNDELAAARGSQIAWAARQAASGYPEAVEQIPAELRDQARDLAARLSEPQVLPVPEGYVLTPER